MSKRLSLLTLIALLALAGMEPAFANKFTTIGSGVGGVSKDKMVMLQQISLWAGVFFVFLGGVALLGRRRFESYVVAYTGKPFEIATAAPTVLMIIGAVLCGLHFI